MSNEKMMTEDDKWELIRNGGVVVEYRPINKDQVSGLFKSFPVQSYARDIQFENEDGVRLSVSLERVMVAMGMKINNEIEWVQP